MLHLLAPLFLAAACSAAPGQEPKKDDAKKALESLQGNWTVVKVTKNGRIEPEENLKEALLKIEGDKYTVREGKTEFAATLSIDPTTSPKSIELIFRDEGKTFTSKGIWMLEGDTLTLCVGAPEVPRPKEFRSERDSEHLLIVAKKAKK